MSPDEPRPSRHKAALRRLREPLELGAAGNAIDRVLDRVKARFRMLDWLALPAIPLALLGASRLIRGVTLALPFMGEPADPQGSALVLEAGAVYLAAGAVLLLRRRPLLAAFVASPGVVTYSLLVLPPDTAFSAVAALALSYLSVGSALVAFVSRRRDRRDAG